MQATDEMMQVARELLEIEFDDRLSAGIALNIIANQYQTYPAILPLSFDLAGRIAEEFSADDLEKLIKALVLAPGFNGIEGGGSTSPVPALYSAFTIRYPKREPDLTKWIIFNRVNGYDPYGSTGQESNALSLEEFKWRRRARFRLSAAKERLSLAQGVINRAEKATRNLPNAIRRGDLEAVELLLASKPDLAKIYGEFGSMVELASKNGRETMVQFLIERGIK